MYTPEKRKNCQGNDNELLIHQTLEDQPDKRGSQRISSSTNHLEAGTTVTHTLLHLHVHIKQFCVHIETHSTDPLDQDNGGKEDRIVEVSDSALHGDESRNNGAM